ncbi:MAG: two pore domain potassium channel family protein [Alphaproteobacteria bacterium]|nr:two pore domain potassium channel family protein [Alphaproteobacteria bacterium]
MIAQITIGTGILLVNILMAAVAAMLLEVAFQRSHPFMMREPHRPKLVLMIAGVSLWVLGVVTAAVWVWALAYQALGAFGTLEEAVYFSLVCFTTLGFGDLLMPQNWRILAGMEVANGFLNFGLLTALLIEALRQIRLEQVERRKSRHTPQS